MMMRQLLAGCLMAAAMGVMMGMTSVPDVMSLPQNQDQLLTLRLDQSAKPVLLHVAGQGWQIKPDDKGLGLQITPVKLEGNKWIADRSQVFPLMYWPKNPLELKAVAELGQPRTWHDRMIPLQVSRRGSAIDLWLEGQWVGRVNHPASESALLTAELGDGDELSLYSSTASSSTWRWTPLHLVHASSDITQWAKSQPQSMTLQDVPFVRHASMLPLDLSQAGWVDWQSDPGDYYESYDGGSYMIHDPRMTVLRLPAQDLTAVHLLASALDDPQMDNLITLRIGRFGGVNHRVVFHDIEARVPRESSLGSEQQIVEIQGRRYVPVRIPVSLAIAQDLGGVLQIEITKQVRLAVRQPDPNRFRRRPLGLDCGVSVAAVTLERPAVSMAVTSDETGHAFCEPQKPRFDVQLKNQADLPQSGKVHAVATSLDGVKVEVATTYQLEAQESGKLALDLPLTQRGYYDVSVTLEDASGQALLRRETSAALLPPLSQRQHRDISPFGCWDFGGQHHTSPDPDQVGPLYEKLGFRYGMFTFTPEKRARWGVMKGSEPAVTNSSSRQAPGASAQAYEKTVKRHPDQVPAALLFHEGILTNVQAQRTPDLFHDRPAYVMSDSEQARFDRLWEDAQVAAKYMREHFPEIHLRLGNGLLTFKESFYARGFPKNLFDSGGSEAGSFSRLPETQPPDPVAYNATLWMDRQLLDAHGYQDKPVTQCYEIGLASSNPGNLSLTTQADYTIRMALLSMAWGMPEIRPGLISDTGNSYYFSHWGAAGYVNAYPELNVKPLFVAMSTLTWVLDGAKLVQELPTGSATIQSVLFRRADGDHVQAMWTIRGSRPVTLQLAPGQKAIWINDQGREYPLEPDVLDRVVVTISPSPSYVRSADGSSIVSLGQPVYVPPTPATVLDPLSSLSDWQVQNDADLVLEYYNSFTPRKAALFDWTTAHDASTNRKVWRVTPQAASMEAGKATMPRYMAIRHESGLVLPKNAGAISVMVNGNGSWGRVIYDLQDASGQRWTSIGAPMPNPPAVWDHESLSNDLREKIRKIGVNDWNSDDVFGESRINHDGWRQMTFELPGYYPGEGYGRPVNSQWRHDMDGRIHYPLKLRQIIIELPPRTLTLTQFRPVLQPWIELRDLATIPWSE